MWSSTMLSPHVVPLRRAHLRMTLMHGIIITGRTEQHAHVSLYTSVAQLLHVFSLQELGEGECIDWTTSRNHGVCTPH